LEYPGVWERSPQFGPTFQDRSGLDFNGIPHFQIAKPVFSEHLSEEPSRLGTRAMTGCNSLDTSRDKALNDSIDPI